MHAAAVERNSVIPHFRLIASVVALTFLLSALVIAPVAATARGDGLRNAANSHRESGGLDLVVGTPLLDDIADARANQMASANRLEHDLAYVGNRLDRAGVCHGTVGEIIAWESGYYADYSYDRTMNLWWDSPGHHAIIMTAAYNAAGGAWATASDGGHYSVMVFVELCEQPATASATLLRPAQRYDPDRRMAFRKGTHTGYKLTSTGAVLESTSVTFGTWKRFLAAGRTRVDGHAWLKVSTGPLAGYWVPETPRSYVMGTTAKRTFKPARGLTFAAGTYTGRTFDRRGHVTDTKTATLRSPSGADASARAIINGRSYYRIKNGIWAGYWIRNSRRVDPA